MSELTLADILAASVRPAKARPEVGWRYWRVEWGPEERVGQIVEDVEKEFAAAGRATLYQQIYTPSLVLLSGWRTLWPKRRELVASCALSAPHFPPDPACACGIYAMRSWGNHYLRTSHLPNGWSESFVVQRVFGQVNLWGRVIPGVRGWRAEYAYPRRLYVPTTQYAGGPAVAPEEIAFHLADYGVPVEIVRTVEEVVA